MKKNNILISFITSVIAFAVMAPAVWIVAMHILFGTEITLKNFVCGAVGFYMTFLVIKVIDFIFTLVGLTVRVWKYNRISKE